MVPSSSYEILQVRGFTGHPFGPVDTIAVMCCPVLHNAINTLPFEDNLVLEVISFAQSFPRFTRSILRRKTCPLDQHHPLRGCDRCVQFPIQNGQGSDDGMMINSKGRKGSVNGRQRPVVRFQKRNVENVVDARIIGQGQSHWAGPVCKPQSQYVRVPDRVHKSASRASNTSGAGTSGGMGEDGDRPSLRQRSGYRACAYLQLTSWRFGL